MNGLHVSPVSREVLDHESPVASLGCGFATQQHRRVLEGTRTKVGLDLALDHEMSESLLVFVPRDSPFAVCGKKLLRGSEHGIVAVLRV